jgi:PleD family two-component response regulator
MCDEAAVPPTVTVPKRYDEREIRTVNPSKPRILLVEDEATLREHLADALADGGQRVLVVDDNLDEAASRAPAPPPAARPRPT